MRDEKGQYKKGEAPGRPPGTQNKLTRTVRETVLSVFNNLQEDPVHNLEAFAKKYPRDYYAIAAKLIPAEMSHSGIITQKLIIEDAPGCDPIGGDSKV